MPTVKSLNQAMTYIRNVINTSLRTEVLDAVRKEEAKQVQSVVYDSYEPTEYERRDDMKKDVNIIGTVNGTVLHVENITPPNSKGNPPPTTDKDLAKVIETGVGYDYFSPGARPFTQATVDALSASGAHVQALKNGLVKAGIRVK